MPPSPEEVRAREEHRRVVANILSSIVHKLWMPAEPSPTAYLWRRVPEREVYAAMCGPGRSMLPSHVAEALQMGLVGGTLERRDPGGNDPAGRAYTLSPASKLEDEWGFPDGIPFGWELPDAEPAKALLRLRAECRAQEEIKRRQAALPKLDTEAPAYDLEANKAREAERSKRAQEMLTKRGPEPREAPRVPVGPNATAAAVGVFAARAANGWRMSSAAYRALTASGGPKFWEFEARRVGKAGAVGEWDWRVPRNIALEVFRAARGGTVRLHRMAHGGWELGKGLRKAAHATIDLRGVLRSPSFDEGMWVFENWARGDTPSAGKWVLACPTIEGGILLSPQGRALLRARSHGAVKGSETLYRMAATGVYVPEGHTATRDAVVARVWFVPKVNGAYDIPELLRPTAGRKP